MNKLNIQSCPLCNNTQLKHLITCTDYYSSGEKFELYVCEKCRFTFTQNFPEGSGIDKYYDSSDYISHTDTKKGIVNSVYHRVRRYMLRKKVNLVIAESGKKTGRLLDIGAGTGYFADAILKKGWQVDAIEKNEDAREYAKSKFGIDMNGEESLALLDSNTYDAITLWHVMEHLEQLNETWQRLFALLKQTGVLIIAVPNSASYDARKYGADWAAYDVPRHLWHFNPATMKQMGEKHGFTLCRYRPMPFDAFYISMLSEKNRGGKLPFIKGLYVGSKAFVSSWRKKERSSSIIYIFRKKQAA